jgi:hypothetical protein
MPVDHLNRFTAAISTLNAPTVAAQYSLESRMIFREWTDAEDSLVGMHAYTMNRGTAFGSITKRWHVAFGGRELWHFVSFGFGILWGADPLSALTSFEAAVTGRRPHHLPHAAMMRGRI